MFFTSGIRQWTILERWETIKMSLTILQLCKLTGQRKFPVRAQKGEFRSMVVSLSWGDRARNLGIATWLDFAARVPERRERHREEVLDICRVLFLTIQLNTDGHMHGLKYPSLRKRPPEKIRGNNPTSQHGKPHNAWSCIHGSVVFLCLNKRENNAASFSKGLKKTQKQRKWFQE